MSGPSLVVECASCPVRHVRCEDCVVTALERHSAAPADRDDLPLDPAERAAVDAFARAGLVTPEYAAAVRARRTASVGEVRRAAG